MSRAARVLRRLPLHGAALLQVAAVRLALTVRSADWVRARWLPDAAHAPAVPDAEAFEGCRVLHVTRAVGRMARLVPAASCLTQALAAQVMLARRGQGATVHLGARSTEAKGFEAHAWLVSGGYLLLGGPAEKVASYAELAAYGPHRPPASPAGARSPAAADA